MDVEVTPPSKRGEIASTSSPNREEAMDIEDAVEGGVAA
jgi:hypothetical protein